MDLLSGCWAICTLSHLGANTGKRVRHLEPMKFRDCTKGKYQSSGKQQKKKKIRQYWGGHTDSKVCSEKKQPNYYYHLGNSLSISPVILDPHLLHHTPQTENNPVTKFSFLKALWEDFALCLLWLSQTKSYFLQWWWWKVNLPWTPHMPELGFNMAKLMCEPVLLFNVVSIKVFIKPGAAAGPH